jgi:hypothetical protein
MSIMRAQTASPFCSCKIHNMCTGSPLSIKDQPGLVGSLQNPLLRHTASTGRMHPAGCHQQLPLTFHLIPRVIWNNIPTRNLCITMTRAASTATNLGLQTPALLLVLFFHKLLSLPSSNQACCTHSNRTQVCKALCYLFTSSPYICPCECYRALTTHLVGWLLVS